MQSANIFARAIAAFQSRHFEDAARDLKKFLKREPKHVGALGLYGVALLQSGRFDEAESCLRKAISINPESDKIFYNYGLVLKNLNKFDEALEAFSKSIAIAPNASEAWNNRGTVLNNLKRYEEAIQDFERALSLDKNYAGALSNKGKSLFMLGRRKDALAVYWSAIDTDPNLPEAWLGIGNVSAALYNYSQALLAFDRALELRPAFPQALRDKGGVLILLSKFEEARDAFELAVKQAPDADFAQGYLIFTKAQLCDWKHLAKETAACMAGLQNGALTLQPFVTFSVQCTLAEQLECASLFYRKTSPPRAEEASSNRHTSRHGPIRIAYLSEDFRDHPVSHAIAGVLEQHDRSRFETIGVSLSPDSSSHMRQRIKSAFQHFHDVSAKSDAEIAEFLRSLDVDIAVDLTGYTQGMRPGILARRPARVQVSYLGYPGTMGAPYIDYIIGDFTVISAGDRQYYAEQVAYLPHSYLPNDRTRQIAETTPTRQSEGLPANGVVFCVFNSTFKISPEIFDVWMRLLGKIEGSVLWLRGTGAVARANMIKEAAKRGISGDRLVFAGRTEQQADHLARHRLANLFLDTLNYNAHTTACDALWAGLPLLTCIGSTFAGRVGASVLNAVGLPELITTSLEDYEALALKLARDPALLAGIKAKLAANRLTTPLFDTKRYTRHLEAAYVAMYERAQRGEPPESFAVEALPN